MPASSLCRADVEALLETTFLQAVHFFPELPSTNDEALRRADEADRLPGLFVAARQTSGRGRGSNRWIAADGALTFSLLTDVSRIRSQQVSWPQLSLWTALGVRHGLAQIVASDELQVKWPNDVYLSQRKVCGILIENVPGSPHRFVVGIGVNVSNAVASFCDGQDLSKTAIALTDIRDDVRIAEVLREILRGIEAAWSQFGKRASIQDAWKPHCFLTGKSIQWRSGTSTYTGICGGICRDGALRLQSARELDAPHERARTIKCYGGTICF